MYGNGEEENNGVDKALQGALSHLEDRVLHHQFLLHEEPFELADFVGFLVSLGQIEPLFSDLARAILGFCKVGLDDVSELVDPGFTKLKAHA